MSFAEKTLAPEAATTTTDRKGSISGTDAACLAPVETQVAEGAVKGADSERTMSLGEGLKLYPKAIGWSVLISTCIIMEGFDIVLINNLYALPSFQNRFGEQLADGSYEIPAAWQSGLSNGALIGEILGLMFVGYIVERLGYRMTLIAALTMLACMVFLLFFAQNLPMLLVGEIMCGLPWGAFQTLTTTYASEVVPVALRPYLTTYVNLCWVMGQFLASGVLKGVSGIEGPLGYKLPYGLQWMWPIPLITGIYLAPESPWWLVRKNRIEDAKKQLLRLTSAKEDFKPQETIDMMVYTTEFEREHTAHARYWDCFKGVNLRRTEAVCAVWAIQTLCGSPSITGFSTYFFVQAGLSDADAFSMSLGVYGLGAVGTMLSWWLLSYFGRRTLYLWGQIVMIALMLAIGFCGFAGNTASQWAIGSMVLVYTFVYDATVGPVCYSLVAELSSTRLRNKTVVLARNCFNITGIIANTLTPHMLNPESWNWGAKTALFWAGSCILCATWTYFRLPEPKGRTFVEMDMLFEHRISARKFAKTDVSELAARSASVAVDARTDQKTEQATKIESVT